MGNLSPVAAAGEALRQMRDDKGWSAATLASRIHDASLKVGGVEFPLTQQAVSKFEGGKAKSIPPWYRLALRLLGEDNDELLPDQDRDDPTQTYVSVEVLPTFGGMGGGGSGDGSKGFALVSRRLIEEELNGRPEDFLLIDTRGDSMEPDFKQGDQILIDKRDRDPVQPGPFAVWDGDGYVVKIIDRVPGQRGSLRIFSANVRYMEHISSSDDVIIMGRPVWYGRRL